MAQNGSGGLWRGLEGSVWLQIDPNCSKLLQIALNVEVGRIRQARPDQNTEVKLYKKVKEVQNYIKYKQVQRKLKNTIWYKNIKHTNVILYSTKYNNHENRTIFFIHKVRTKSKKTKKNPKRNKTKTQKS